MDLSLFNERIINRMVRISFADIEISEADTGDAKLDKKLNSEINKDCLLIFKNLYKNSKLREEAFKKKAMKFAEGFGGTFVSFNPVSNETIIFCSKPLT